MMYRHALSPKSPEEGAGSPRAEITGGIEPEPPLRALGSEL